MKKIEINVTRITDKKELHSVLKDRLGFPEYYGNNLDALHDCLTDICEDTCIFITGFEELKGELGGYADTFLWVIDDSSRENPHLSYIVKKDAEPIKRYNAVFLDLDGTLTDPAEGITNSVMYALSKWNIKVEDRKELFKFIGPPLKESFMKYYGFTEEEAAEAVIYYREYYMDKGIRENIVYEETERFLAYLKDRGYIIVLATSKPTLFAEDILRHFELDWYFDHIIGATIDESRTHKGEVISYALDFGEIDDKTRTVIVGDREDDILGARDNGIDSIAVRYGFGTLREICEAGPDFIAGTMQDLREIL
ncbi:MAG: HAD hydrolase-like protein [Lachnospiraceae bacterium]|nr:HAD hydrolase-like protein [Lachnospiraceae bacterium]